MLWIMRNKSNQWSLDLRRSSCIHGESRVKNCLFADNTQIVFDVDSIVPEGDNNGCFEAEVASSAPRLKVVGNATSGTRQLISNNLSSQHELYDTRSRVFVYIGLPEIRGKA